MSDYPECEKMLVISETSNAIGEFVDWLATKGIWLAERCESGQMFAIRQSIQTLLAEFFGIDLVKVDLEKREMLDALREGARP